MFSPSLVSMLFHSFDPPGLGPPATTTRSVSAERRSIHASPTQWLVILLHNGMRAQEPLGLQAALDR